MAWFDRVSFHMNVLVLLACLGTYMVRQAERERESRMRHIGDPSTKEKSRNR